MANESPRPLPQSSRFDLAPGLEICRVLNGLWQVSGGHGRIEPELAVEDMFRYIDSGFTTWDLADHYGPAEDFIGEFRRRLKAQRGSEALSAVQALTKWVPRPGAMDRGWVEQNVDKALRRMDTETLDLLQFHWWDYGDERYLEALGHLSDLRDQGKIRHLGLTNFDTDHLQKIIEAGIPVTSNQVQYSLIDRRPDVRMAPYCQQNGVHLLAYGTVAGGLLSQRYAGQPEPARADLNTSSLGKYKQMQSAWGSWELFQKLLATLGDIARRHNVSVPNIAVGYILDRPAVAGVIVGARLGVAEHRQDNSRVFDFALAEDDLARIESVLQDSRDLYPIIGDCGDEYRG